MSSQLSKKQQKLLTILLGKSKDISVYSAHCRKILGRPDMEVLLVDIIQRMSPDIVKQNIKLQNHDIHLYNILKDMPFQIFNFYIMEMLSYEDILRMKYVFPERVKKTGILKRVKYFKNLIIGKEDSSGLQFVSRIPPEESKKYYNDLYNCMLTEDVSDGNFFDFMRKNKLVNKFVEVEIASYDVYDYQIIHQIEQIQDVLKLSRGLYEYLGGDAYTGLEEILNEYNIPILHEGEDDDKIKEIEEIKKKIIMDEGDYDEKENLEYFLFPKEPPDNVSIYFDECYTDLYMHIMIEILQLKNGVRQLILTYEQNFNDSNPFLVHVYEEIGKKI